MKRRSFITSVASLFIAPAIVKAENIMRISTQGIYKPSPKIQFGHHLRDGIWIERWPDSGVFDRFTMPDDLIVHLGEYEKVRVVQSSSTEGIKI